MVVMLVGIETEKSRKHPENAPCEMVVIPSGNARDINPEQSLKEPFPMDSSPVGKLMEDNDEHPLKA